MELVHDAYTNFQNFSDIVNSHYSMKDAIDHDQYHFSIESWLKTDLDNGQENLPLLIVGKQGSGKTHLISNWIKYHQNINRKKHPDIIITHYTRVSQINKQYEYCIYNILSKLKEILKINQKVEVLEENLRHYFGYWLEICDKQLENEIVNDSNIIVIIESGDKFINKENGQELQIGFWLPKLIPKRIRFIITCEEDSKCHNTLKNKNCRQINFESLKQDAFEIIQQHLQGDNLIDKELAQNIIMILNEQSEELLQDQFFVKLWLNLLLPKGIAYKQQINSTIKKLNLNELKNIRSMQQFMSVILNFFSKNLMQEQSFIKMFAYLMLSQKGLTKSQLVKLAKITKEQFELTEIFFQQYLAYNNDRILFLNYSFRQEIINFINIDENTSKKYHEDIFNCLDKYPTSLNILEEQLFHSYSNQNVFQISEKISDIDNFLLLFNNNTKYHLFNYWQFLEHRHIDPVQEYNRQIEAFVVKYNPSNEDLFKVILQLSRFFKEFTDFEQKHQPQFRHALICGGDELDSIGFMKEAQKMEMYYVKDEPILNAVEQLNIDIPQNREIIRHHLHKLAKQSIKEKTPDLNMKLVEKNQQDQQSEATNDEFEDEEYSLRKEKWQQLELSKHIVETNDDIQQKSNQFYYYKRWLWIIFPWACLSHHSDCNFSDQIENCIKSVTSYMQIEDEQILNLKTIIISLEAKIQKILSYSQNDTAKKQLEDLNIIKQNLRTLELQQVKKSNNSRIKTKESKKFQYSRLNYSSIQQQKPLRIKEQRLIDRVTGMSSVEDFKSSSNLLDRSHLFLTNNDSRYGSKSQSFLFKLNQSHSSSSLSKSRDFNSKMKSTNNLLTSSSNNILPKLNESYQNASYQQIRQQSNFISQQIFFFNSIVQENEKLERTLIEYNLFLNQENSKSKLELTEEIKIAQKIHFLEENITKEEISMQEGLASLEVIQKISKICDDNKKQNEITVKAINYLLQNYINLHKYEVQNKLDVQSQLKQQLSYNKEFQHEVNKQNNLNQKMIEQVIENFKRKKNMISKIQKYEEDHNVDNSVVIIKKKSSNIKSNNKIIQKIEPALDPQLIQIQNLNKIHEYKNKIPFLNEIILDLNETLKGNEICTFSEKLKHFSSLKQKNDLQKVQNEDKYQTIMKLNKKINQLQEHLKKIKQSGIQPKKSRKQSENNQTQETDLKQELKQYEKKQIILQDSLKITQNIRVTSLISLHNISSKYHLNQIITNINHFNFKEFINQNQKIMKIIQDNVDSEFYQQVESGNFKINFIYKTNQ